MPVLQEPADPSSMSRIVRTHAACMFWSCSSAVGVPHAAAQRVAGLADLDQAFRKAMERVGMDASGVPPPQPPGSVREAELIARIAALEAKLHSHGA